MPDSAEMEALRVDRERVVDTAIYDLSHRVAAGLMSQHHAWHVGLGGIYQMGVETGLVLAAHMPEQAMRLLAAIDHEVHEGDRQATEVERHAMLDLYREAMR